MNQLSSSVRGKTQAGFIGQFFLYFVFSPDLVHDVGAIHGLC